MQQETTITKDGRILVWKRAPTLAAAALLAITATAYARQLPDPAPENSAEAVVWKSCAEKFAHPTDGVCEAYAKAAADHGLVPTDHGRYIPAGGM